MAANWYGLIDGFIVSLARHVITDKSSLKEATALLHESSLLRLEDVFPFFPDFVTIDEFRVSLIGHNRLHLLFIRK